MSVDNDQHGLVFVNSLTQNLIPFEQVVQDVSRYSVAQ